MTEGDKEDEGDEHDGTWHGLDETQFRMNIRAVAEDIVAHEVDSYARMIRELGRVRQIVAEELGTALRRDLNLYIEYQDTSTRAACRVLADRVNADLSELGLALSLPGAPFPAKLGVAATPPGPSQSWLQLEPLDTSSGRRPRRLSGPALDKLDLIPAEPAQAGRGHAR